MGIRGKLLILAVGIALPLVIVGALDLRNMWLLSRAQMDDSVKRQVELVSVVLERWLADQRKALASISALAGDRDSNSPAIRENLEKVLGSRPFWMDLRIANASGTTVMSQPARKEILPNALTDYLVSEMRDLNSWAVVTDRTVDEERPIVIIAVPLEKGGAVIARIDGAAINELFDHIELSPQAVISVLDSDGRRLYRRRGSESSMESDLGWAPFSSGLGTTQTSVVELTSPIDGIKRVYGIAHIRNTGLIAMIGVPSSTLFEPARRRLIRYALVGLIALLLAVGAALVIERSIVLPVRRLRSTAQQLGTGDLTSRTNIKEGGEIGDLAMAFNAMAARIAEREERLTELDRLKSDFVSSVSHELKTPLTTIKVLAHLLERAELNDGERLDYAKTISTECDRQIDFVGNLLDLSRIESGAYQPGRGLVETRRLIESCVDVERFRAQSLGLDLKADLATTLPPVQGDFEALRRVVRGLIDNAIKYTPEGGCVRVSAHVDGNMVAIQVRDNGRGIPAADLPHVFDKFYRAGSEDLETHDGFSLSPGTAAPGVGLGLYLARHIVEQFGGEITVESKHKNTVFTVLLPAFDGANNSETTCEVSANVETVTTS